MRPENINTVAHRQMQKRLTENSIVVDATCGNGQDTLFLSTYAGHVYAFDIQEAAIKNTQKLCKDRKNITYIHASHADMDSYVDKANLVVFNLGYLPKGDPSLTTQTESTMMAIEKALQLMDENESVFVTFYTGHSEGKKEYEWFIHHIPENCRIEYTYTYIDRANAPVLFELIKTEQKEKEA